ncbi:hypothetical protein [Spiroplasma endosymbiont of Crioceris asparagi]|uniref:hypothetical protein n=1 Tax=Spiroplasma endosymbiont of Crioceris asparagi TaxID=3066286 RepID=UPI0030D10CC8
MNKTKWNFKLTFKKQWTKEFRFWYKLFFGLIGLTMVTWGFFYGMSNNGINDKYKGSFIFYCLQTTSYFTWQTNMLVIVWFIYGAIHHDKEGRSGLNGINWSWAITTFITCTMLIPHLWFLPTELISNALAKKELADLGKEGWTYVREANNQTYGSELSGTVVVLITEFFHLLMPLSMIFYLCFWFKADKEYLVDLKKVMKQYIPFICLYPVLFSIVTICIGELKYLGGFKYDQQYPYFFFFIHENGHNPDYTWVIKAPDGHTEQTNWMSYPLAGIHISGAAWAIITTFLFLAIIIGFGTLYYWTLIKKANKIKNTVN